MRKKEEDVCELNALMSVIELCSINLLYSCFSLCDCRSLWEPVFSTNILLQTSLRLTAVLYIYNNTRVWPQISVSCF